MSSAEPSPMLRGAGAPAGGRRRSGIVFGETLGWQLVEGPKGGADFETRDVVRALKCCRARCRETWDLPPVVTHTIADYLPKIQRGASVKLWQLGGQWKSSLDEYPLVMNDLKAKTFDPRRQATDMWCKFENNGESYEVERKEDSGLIHINNWQVVECSPIHCVFQETIAAPDNNNWMASLLRRWMSGEAKPRRIRWVRRTRRHQVRKLDPQFKLYEKYAYRLDSNDWADESDQQSEEGRQPTTPALAEDNPPMNPPGGPPVAAGEAGEPDHDHPWDLHRDDDGDAVGGLADDHPAGGRGNVGF